MEVTKDQANRTLFIDQTAFIDRMLKDLGIEKCKSTKVIMNSGTEMVINRYISEDYKATKKEIQGYQLLVSTVVWLACMTRLDISFAVRKYSRYSSNPTPSHEVALKIIVRYLKESKELSPRYGARLKNIYGKSLGYTDALYRNCLDTSCSTSAYIYLFWNGPVSWSNKLQKTVTTSKAEAEYVEEFNAGKKLVFLAGSLKRIGYEKSDVNTLLFLTDNQTAIKLALNPVNQPRAKHMRIQYHKAGELISDDVLKLDYILTEDMVADGLTKPRALTNQEYLITILGLRNKRQKWPCRGCQQTWMGVLVIKSRWQFY